MYSIRSNRCCVRYVTGGCWGANHEVAASPACIVFHIVKRGALRHTSLKDIPDPEASMVDRAWVDDLVSRDGCEYLVR